MALNTAEKEYTVNAILDCNVTKTLDT